jgi:hypothetical protein
VRGQRAQVAAVLLVALLMAVVIEVGGVLLASGAPQEIRGESKATSVLERGSPAVRPTFGAGRTSRSGSAEGSRTRTEEGPTTWSPSAEPLVPWWEGVEAVYRCGYEGTLLCADAVTSEPQVIPLAEWRQRAREVAQCGPVYEGVRLSPARAVELVAAYDWTPYTAEEMADLFERESNRYVGAQNTCTNDYGYTQNNEIHVSRPECRDLERMTVDVVYALDCANAIFEDQGIEAWMAAEGVLW